MASPTDTARATALRPAALALAGAFALPLLYLAFQAGTDGAVRTALGEDDLLGPLWRSLLLATIVALGAAVIGTATAWAVTRTDLPGRRVWRVLLPLPLVIPSFIGAFALIAAFAPGGLVAELVGSDVLPQVRGLPGAAAVLTLLTYPYVHLPVAARLRQLPPSFEEAARLLGRSPGRTFLQVVLPQVWGAILAGSLLVFLYAISDFGAVQLLRYDTFTRAIYVAYKSFDQATGVALALNLGVLALLVVVLERIATRRLRAPATGRGVAPVAVVLGRWRPVLTATVAAVVGLSLAAPVSVLLYWAVRGILRGGSRASALAVDPLALLEPAYNTARVSVVAAVVAVVAVLPIAFLAVRHRSRTGEVANALVVAGFALPGIAIALALTFWALRSGPVGTLYQTEALLVFAYVVHFGAQSLRAAEVAVASVPPRLGDAARMLGAGRWRRLRRVDLPLMLPGLLAGGGLVLLSTMKELPATLLLSPPGFQTLATRIWSATEFAFLADASIAALVLVGLSGVLTWWLVIRRSDAL